MNDVSQDGGEGGEGRVVCTPDNGWLDVEWTKNGSTQSYRYGYDGKYDVVSLSNLSHLFSLEKFWKVSVVSLVLSSGMCVQERIDGGRPTGGPSASTSG